jgi:hypothetical protein
MNSKQKRGNSEQESSSTMQNDVERGGNALKVLGGEMTGMTRRDVAVRKRNRKIRFTSKQWSEFKLVSYIKTQFAASMPLSTPSA